MTIQVGGYTIHSDGYCYWITAEKPSPKSKRENAFVDYKVAGYSTTLENLYRSFVDKKILGSDAEDLKELLSLLRSIEKDLKEFRTTDIEKEFQKLARRANK